jgi:hypothetical protein
MTFEPGMWIIPAVITLVAMVYLRNLPGPSGGPSDISHGVKFFYAPFVLIVVWLTYFIAHHYGMPA